MKTKRWLLLDVPGLAHRAWHVMMDLEHEGKKTGVIFGILRDIARMQNQFDTSYIVFCFDEGESFRKKIYPEYKANRNREGKKSLYRQIESLRRKILPSLGFANVISHNGYEADDLIGFYSQLFAALGDEVVIVSRDHDMRQLLTEDNRVTIFDPQIKASFTWKQFVNEWHGLTPKRYPELIALMGDVGDNIFGIKGVGPVLAAGILNNKTKSNVMEKFRLFKDSGSFDNNLKLVTLPWPGLGSLTMQFNKDNVTQAAWNKVCEEYGMDSLIPMCPRTSAAQLPT